MPVGTGNNLVVVPVVVNYKMQISKFYCTNILAFQAKKGWFFFLLPLLWHFLSSFLQVSFFPLLRWQREDHNKEATPFFLLPLPSLAFFLLCLCVEAGEEVREEEESPGRTNPLKKDKIFCPFFPPECVGAFFRLPSFSKFHFWKTESSWKKLKLATTLFFWRSN